MIDINDISFALNAFMLLGIERILYGYWFIYPNKFKAKVRQGVFGRNIKDKPYWKAAMTLGKYVKVFQFSVVIWDLLYRCDIQTSFDLNYKTRCGLLLLVVGQGLNVAVFNALGGIGVYYGHEFGYSVPRVSNFPYNVSWISDPQYWGVVLTVWGIYLFLNASSYVVPVLETCWYLTSMKFLEHCRGILVIRDIFGEDLYVDK